MPSGEHPNSKANLSKGKRFSEENAREMAEKSHEARRANGMLSADLKGQLDEETIERLNKKLIAMAEKGNLKAYELIRDGIGEKPIEKQQQIDATSEVYADYVREKKDSGRSDI